MDLLQLLCRTFGWKVVAACIFEHTPCEIRSNGSIHKPGKLFGPLASQDSLTHELAQAVDVFVSIGTLHHFRHIHSMLLHHSGFEVVMHTHEPFRADELCI